MFETAILSNGPRTKRVWATIAGFTGQVIVIGCALIAPLLFPQVIPRVQWAVSVVGPPPPPPPPPPTLGGVVPHRNRSFSQFSDGALRMPQRIPDKPVKTIDDAPVANNNGVGVVGGVEGGDPNGKIGGVLNSIFASSRATAEAPPPVREAPKKPVDPGPTVTKPPRISVVEMAKPINRVDPVYPTLAKQARISGTVELVGVLGIDGRIHELRVVRGHPLLIDAAMAAVRQWIYAPTILNGQPVEVQAPITVNFILNH